MISLSFEFEGVQLQLCPYFLSLVIATYLKSQGMHKQNWLSFPEEAWLFVCLL